MPSQEEQGRGFTLVEIMAVVLIVGGTVAMALPNYSVAVQKVRNQEAYPVLLSIYEAQRERSQAGVPYATAAGISNINTALGLELPGALDHFDSVSTYAVKKLNVIPADIARLADLDDQYYLYILEDGRIVCKGFGTPAGEIGPLCQKMGFENFDEQASSAASSASSSSGSGSGPKGGCGASPPDPDYKILTLF